ncbi:MAG: protein-L-isoaspartate(D-aspartate) O-methyltransferase [Magnetococcales bacterium]|nr:protein-L-isoaspartate(D-aspartate) O-methyltransferase [Magnetococcales bacterium]
MTNWHDRTNPTPGIDPESTRWQRQEMIRHQLQARAITDPEVLHAMTIIPRELFVPREYAEQAYADGPIPIGEGQTISQPYMVAVMAQLLGTDHSRTLLEIGTGSGYGAAILSRLAKRVISLERIPSLLDQARQRWRHLGLDNIDGLLGDGTLGCPEQAPFDGICVTAAAPRIPIPLLQQLKPISGRLVVPVGPRFAQILQCIQLDNEGNSVVTSLFDCVFVPLIGHHGWMPGGRSA